MAFTGVRGIFVLDYISYDYRVCPYTLEAWTSSLFSLRHVGEAVFFFWLCYRKWLMFFSLKLQRDNRKNALAVDPAKGKT